MHVGVELASAIQSTWPEVALLQWSDIGLLVAADMLHKLGQVSDSCKQAHHDRHCSAAVILHDLTSRSAKLQT